MSNPLRCERCGRPLESDDAISIIEGNCGPCRGQASPPAWQSTSMPRASAPRIAPPTVSPRPQPLRAIPRPQPLGAVPPAQPAFKSSFDEPVFRDPLPTQRLSAPTLRPVTTLPPFSRPSPPPFNYDVHAAQRIRRRRRDLLVGVSVGLVITVCITGYFLSSRSDQPSLRLPHSASVPIALTVKPAFAKVTLDGQDVGKPNEAGKLKLSIPANGTTMQWLEVAAKGYHPVRRPVSAYGGVGEVTVELIQKPYEVVVQTTPPKAEVWINDGTKNGKSEMKGYSPLNFTLLPGQTAQLAVKHTGYQSVTREIAPPVDSERVELNLPMIALGMLARVETDPPGAQIAVNGDLRGISPMDVPVTPDMLGKEVEVTASLVGYEDARGKIAIPKDPAAKLPPTALSLVAMGPKMEVVTTPPGARILVDSQDRGASPLVLNFPAGKAGQSVVVEATLGASQYGKQTVAIPAPGMPLKLTIPMAAPTGAVVFIVASTASSGADHFALQSEIKDQIHRLRADQRFAILISTDHGLKTWPEDNSLQVANSDQKIRAYDTVRSMRPADRGDLVEALDASLKLKPAVVWFFTAGELPTDQLDQMSIAAAGSGAAVHFVTTTPGAQDALVKQWAAQHRGTFTILGRDRSPAVAMDTQSN